MVIKWGRNGEFLACPGYPECRNTMNFRREDGKIVPEKEEDVPVEDKCPECGAPMVMKRGRFGRFLACTRYPDCKGTKPRLDRRLLPEGLRRLHLGEALATRQDVLRLLVVPEVRLRELGPAAERGVPAVRERVPARQVLEEDRSLRRLPEQGVRLPARGRAARRGRCDRCGGPGELCGSGGLGGSSGRLWGTWGGSGGLRGPVGSRAAPRAGKGVGGGGGRQEGLGPQEGRPQAPGLRSRAWRDPKDAASDLASSCAA